MSDFDEVLRSALEGSEGDQILVAVGEATVVDLFRYELVDRDLEREELKRPVSVKRFLVENGEVLEEKRHRGSKEKRTVLRLDEDVWRASEKMADDRVDWNILKREGFESVVERHRIARELDGEVLSLTRKGLNDMGLIKYEKNLVEMFEMIVNYAKEIDCSVEAAAASLRMYKDDFDEHYSKLKREIEKAARNADLYERVLEKID